MTHGSHNSKSAIDVDTVVEAVMRRLAADGSPSGATRVAPAGVVRLTARVVTLEALPESLADIREVQLQPRAVLTPSARDRLRAAKVAWTFGRDAAAARPESGLVIGVIASAPARAFWSQWAQRQSGVTLLAGGSLSESVAAVCQALRDASPQGVLIADEPQAACCLANRWRHVRAAAAASPGELTHLLETLGLNLLVVDPRSAASYAVRRMIERFRDARRRECPAALRAALEGGT